jgi:hypothetical protein
MKIEQITILATLILLVGCSTTPQEITPNPQQKSIISEQPNEVETLTIRATGDVYIQVHDKDTNERLYRSSFSEGESKTLELEDSAYVVFSAGEHVIFEWKGEELKPSRSGQARITLP